MDKLCGLLKDVDYSLLVAALKHGLSVLPLHSIRLTASEFQLAMLSWLKEENPKPSWNVLTSTLTRIGRHGEAIHIGGI